MAGTSTRNVEIGLYVLDKDSGERKFISLANAVQKVTQETEKLNQSQKAGAKAAQEYGNAQQKAGDSLNHFSRHSKISADSVNSFGGIVKMVTKELSTFSFQMWVLASNAALWTGILGGAAAGVNKLVQEGSKFAEVENGFRMMSASSGMFSDEILNKTRPAVRGLINDLDIMKNYNTAVALHVKLNADSFAKMSGAAVTMSRIMGTDVNYAMNSLITGLGRQSMRVLDNIGVILKAQEAYKIYGERNHIAVKDMDDATKRIAFQTIAVERLEENIKKIGEPITTMGQAFTQAKVAIENAAMKTLAWVVTSDKGMGSANSFKEAVENLGKSIWDSREAIADAISRAVSFGKTIVEVVQSVASFLNEWGSLLVTLAEVSIFLKILSMFQSIGVALNAWGMAVLKAGAEERAWAENTVMSANMRKAAIIQAELAEYQAIEQANIAKIKYMSTQQQLQQVTRSYAGALYLEANGIQIVNAENTSAALLNQKLLLQKQLLTEQTIMQATANESLAASQTLANLQTGKFTAGNRALTEQFYSLKTGMVSAIFTMGNLVTALITGGYFLIKYLRNVENLDDAFDSINKGVSKLDGFQKWSAALQIYIGTPVSATIISLRMLKAAMLHNWDEVKQLGAQAESLKKENDKAWKDLFNPPKDAEEGNKGMFVKLEEMGKQFGVQFEKDANIIPKMNKMVAEFMSQGPMQGQMMMSKFFMAIQRAGEDGAKVTMSAIKQAFKETKMSMMDFGGNDTPDAPKDKKTIEEMLGIDTKKMTEAYNVFHQIYAKYGEDSKQTEVALNAYAKTVLEVGDKLYPHMAKAFGLGYVIDKMQEAGYVIPDAIKAINNFGMTPIKDKDIKITVNGKPLDKGLDDTIKILGNAPEELSKFKAQVEGMRIDASKMLNFGSVTPAEQFMNSFSDSITSLESAYADKLKMPALKLGISEDDKAAMLDGLQQQIDEAKAKYEEFKIFMDENPVAGNFMVGLTNGFRDMDAVIGEAMAQLGGETMSNFQTFFTNVLSGTKSVSEAFKDLGKSMISSVISALVKIATQWVASHLLMIMFPKLKASAVAQGAAQESAAVVAASGTKIAANTAETASAVGTSMAEFFKAHAWIPFVGAALAIGFIAMMMSTMSSVQGAAQGGAPTVGANTPVHWGTSGQVTPAAPGHMAGLWEVPGGMTDPYPMFAHGKEMIVQAPEAEKIREFTERATTDRSGNMTVAPVINIGNGGEPIFFDDYRNQEKVAKWVSGEVERAVDRALRDGTRKADPYNLYG